MDKIVIDMETYYDKDYSLSKMQTDAYCLDPRYETIGVSVKVNDGPIQWFSGDDLATAGWLHQFDWANSAVVCQNTMFDGFILSQRYGIKPKLWMDTLCMSRFLYPYEFSHSLAAQAKKHGLPEKGTYVANMLGRRRESIAPYELEEYGRYCKHDTELTYLLAEKYLPYIPPLELKLIDMTVRMFVEPKIMLDKEMLEKYRDAVVGHKEDLLQEAGITKDEIMSNDKFAEALIALGVDPPRKISKTTGKYAWAFAKTDEGLTDLLEHDDARVQAVVAARLGVKTTIAETRAQKLVETASRPSKLWDEVRLGRDAVVGKRALEGGVHGAPFPIFLNYWGAKTTGRFSGGNKINAQNIPNRGKDRMIRQAMVAPEGYKLIVGDSSNIELRVAMAAAGQQDVVAKITNGEDLYCDFATKMYGRTITKADKRERMLGKIAMLGLQYGMGWRKFKDTVRQQANEVLSDESAQATVDLYRRVHHKVVDFWEHMEDRVLPEIANGCPSLMPVDQHAWCLCSGKGFGVGGGLGVQYHELHKAPGVDSYGRPTEQWMYTMGKKKATVYGGKAVENYSQHVARQIVMWQTARINEKYPVALSVHDEVVCVVPDSEVDAARAYVEECLSMAPPWCRGTIPLACEVGVGQNYAEAK